MPLFLLGYLVSGIRRQEANNRQSASGVRKPESGDQIP